MIYKLNYTDLQELKKGLVNRECPNNTPKSVVVSAERLESLVDSAIEKEKIEGELKTVTLLLAQTVEAAGGGVFIPKRVLNGCTPILNSFVDPFTGGIQLTTSMPTPFEDLI